MVTILRYSPVQFHGIPFEQRVAANILAPVPHHTEPARSAGQLMTVGKLQSKWWSFPFLGYHSSLISSGADSSLGALLPLSSGSFAAFRASPLDQASC